MELCFRIFFEEDSVTVSSADLTFEKEADGIVYHTRVRNADVTWRFTPAPKGSRITLSVDSNTPLGITRIDSLFFRITDAPITARVLFFGNHLTQITHRYPCEMGENREYATDCTGLFPTPAHSGMALAMIAPFTNAVGAGALRTNDTLHFFAKTEFTKAMQTSCHLEAEEVLWCEDITIDELYTVYRDLLPKSHFSMPRLTGWNTWDYYLDRVTPEDIFENIDALEKMPFADRLDYIVIDDGWQKNWGEWTENEKFACGLDYVANRIRERGFLPGIWTAPLMMKKSCEHFSERQHWFCLNEQGEHLRDVGDLIDPTVPEAREFILNIYRRLYAAGYRLFKIDYLSPLLKARRFYDKNATPYSILRQLILDIRSCTGEDAVILGCSLPVQCGADIAPSMRIGVDIHNHFSHVEWIAEMLSWTWMYNNRTTRIDPDFLIVRCKETSTEAVTPEGEPNYYAPKRRCEQSDADVFRTRWRHADLFNRVEAQTWANLVSICGGNLFLSDRMSCINDVGIEILDQAIRNAAEECRPYFLPTDHRLPTLWRSKSTLLIVNWESTPATIRIDNLPTALISRQPFTMEYGTLTVSLLPHESFFATVP